jgi:hypothetical protein
MIILKTEDNKLEIAHSKSTVAAIKKPLREDGDHA